MHYIQNDWFNTNWLWVMLFFIGSIAVIFYINNKSLLLKKALISFSLFFVFTLVLSFYSPNLFSMKGKDLSLTETSIDNYKIESPSVLTNVLNYVISIFSSKINK